MEPMIPASGDAMGAAVTLARRQARAKVAIVGVRILIEWEDE